MEGSNLRNIVDGIYSNTIEPFTNPKPELLPESHPIDNVVNSESKNNFEQIVCRICMDDCIDDMIAPCLCKGSSKFVHRTCLDQWRGTPSSNLSKFYECNVCKFKYEYVRNYSKSAHKLYFNKCKNALYFFGKLIIFALSFLILFYTTGSIVKNNISDWKKNWSNSNTAITNIAIGLGIIIEIIGLLSEIITLIIIIMNLINFIDDEPIPTPIQVNGELDQTLIQLEEIQTIPPPIMPVQTEQTINIPVNNAIIVDAQQNLINVQSNEFCTTIVSIGKIFCKTILVICLTILAACLILFAVIIMMPIAGTAVMTFTIIIYTNRQYRKYKYANLSSTVSSQIYNIKDFNNEQLTIVTSNI
jgi:hypothetical protein